MQCWHFGVSALAILSLLIANESPARADDAANKARPQKKPEQAEVRRAIDRGLSFLKKDAAEWRQERKCASCHQGIMTVWALSEAKARGFASAGESLPDFVKWSKERLQTIDLPRDSRPGWNMLSTPAVFWSLMALAEPRQEALSADELKRIAGHLVRHQEKDGSWAWSLAPAKNRPPPVFESDEVVTLMAFLVLEPQQPADPKAKSDIRDSRTRAAEWLAKVPPGEGTQAIGLRMLRDVRAHASRDKLEARIRHLLDRQNPNGGWGQDKGLPSDGFATGQALYFLNLAGVARDHAAVQRGLAFLIANQREDGSWPMTPRGHPGVKPMSNPSPITYFGSAWATLGLLRSAPK